MRIGALRIGTSSTAMPSDSGRLRLQAGQIVLADWRGDALPKEPNKIRPAIVVEAVELFGTSYPNALLVPLTEDAALAMPLLSVGIAPTAENGCTKFCWAAAHLITATSRHRVKPTHSRVTRDQLAAIRHKIMLAIGLATGEGG